MSDKRWQHGDIVVFRHVETPTSARMVHAIMGDPARPGGGGEPFLVAGKVVTVGARPYRVIQDSEEVTVLFQPEGTLLPRWHIAERRYLDNPQSTQGVTVRFLYTSKAYDVTLFFEGSGEPPWYYDAFSFARACGQAGGLAALQSLAQPAEPP